MNNNGEKTENTKHKMNTKKIAGLLLFLILFIGGVIGGYLYFKKIFYKGKPPAETAESIITTEDIFSLRIYYPVGDRLQIENRSLPKRNAQMAIAEAVVEEFLKGPTGVTSNIPQDVKLLGLYKDEDKILYIDLSDEFRRNFQGDVLTEFLLLKGLYESIISNVPDIQNVKILIEGKEIETLGGHLYLLYPLRDMVSPEFG
jgi:hypothetical protein